VIRGPASWWAPPLPCAPSTCQIETNVRVPPGSPLGRQGERRGSNGGAAPSARLVADLPRSDEQQCPTPPEMHPSSIHGRPRPGLA
jgi:hypothetical protein